MTLDLEELERLEREATPGPWEDGTAICCPDMGWVDGPRGKGRVCPTHEGGKRTHTLDANDARLIAAARNALPALLARVRELEAALEEIADGSGCDTPPYGDSCDKHCRDIARTALGVRG